MKRILRFTILFYVMLCTNNTLLAQTDRGNKITYHRVCGDFNWNSSKFFWMSLTDLHVDTAHRRLTGTGIVEGSVTNYYVHMNGQYNTVRDFLQFFVEKIHPDPCDPVKLNGVDSFYIFSPDEFTVFFSADQSEIRIEGTVGSSSYCQGDVSNLINLAFTLSTHCHQKPAPLVNKDSPIITKLEVITKVIPNPAVNSATISYTLTKISKVNITVYNAMMQPVKVLVNETKNAGNYSVIWNANASQIKPGIYRVVATVDGISTSKMVQVIK